MSGEKELKDARAASERSRFLAADKQEELNVALARAEVAEAEVKALRQDLEWIASESMRTNGPMPDRLDDIWVRTQAALHRKAESQTKPVAGEEPIHEWFGLTYCNYLVLPRAVLQSMPVLWQRQMVRLLQEGDAAFGHLEWPRSYRVSAIGERGRFIEDPIPHYNRGRTRLEPAAKEPTK